MGRLTGFIARTLTTAAVLITAVGALPSARSADLAVDGRTNAYPSIAAHGRFVAVTWGATTKDGTTDIFVATSVDGGRTFKRPAQVTDVTSQANLSGEQPPRVALVAHTDGVPSVVVTWTSKGQRGTRLLSARSDDGGQSFSRPGVLPGSEAPGNRGWQSIATDSDGRVVTVWLDHRELAPPAGSAASPAHSGHLHGASATQQRDSVARAQLSKLLFVREGRGAQTKALSGGVCYCCKTAIATGPDRSVYTAWRHVYPGNVRDIAFTMSRDGGRTFAPPTRVSEDNWVLDGCPENGPSIAIEGHGRIHVIWPTLVPGSTSDSEPTLALFYAMSEDGRRFTPRLRIPADGFPRHVEMILDARGRVVAAWEEQVGGTRRVVLGRGSPEAGAMKFAREVISDALPAVYPVVAAAADGIVAAWTSGPAGQTVVRTAQLP